MTQASLICLQSLAFRGVVSRGAGAVLCHAVPPRYMKVPGVSARFGTDPFIWNWAMWLVARLCPRQFLQDRSQVCKLFTFCSFPLGLCQCEACVMQGIGSAQQSLVLQVGLEPCASVALLCADTRSAVLG